MKRLTRLGLTAGAVITAGAAAKAIDAQIMERRREDIADLNGFGTLTSTPRTVVSADGTTINVEIDEPNKPGAPTIVFLHGWTCTLDTWHFQRQALRGRFRMIFMDHRSHGGSGRSTRRNSSFNELTADLTAVLDACSPDDPVVVVGHSMGGMTIMELACRHPELYGTRINGVMLIGTSSGKLIREAPAFVKLAPLLRTVGPLVDWTRGLNSRAMMKRWAVGSAASDVAVDMTDIMIRQARTHVLLDFYPNFLELDSTAGLGDIGRVPSVVVCGTEDMLTPFKHSRRLAEAIPGATLVAVEGAGHMVMFEQPQRVTEALVGLMERVG